ncbi:MAG TPA: DoxX family protein [Chitinophagaceae bacterium]|nr:DoxX family protein [Chitinophagaceae bacterium]
MKKLFETNPNNWSALIARLALGIVVFPHGAQKLFGWFGGYGFNGTMGFLTSQARLPYIIALLVILIETFASLFVFFGFATRIAAFGILVNFLGVVFKVHAANGFFMNWAGTQKGEGIEYFLLLFGLAIILLITGGGKASIDAALSSQRRLNISPIL